MSEPAVPIPVRRIDMRPVVRTAIEMARIKKELTIQELSDVTGIAAKTLHSYESGLAFPRANDVTILETHLETTILP